jgi:hypothetical protein
MKLQIIPVTERKFRKDEDPDFISYCKSLDEFQERINMRLRRQQKVDLIKGQYRKVILD